MSWLSKGTQRVFIKRSSRTSINTCRPNSPTAAPNDSWSPKKSHGRPEQRIVIPMPAPKTLPGFGRWSSLKTIAVVMLMSQRDEKETYATRYFISRLAMDVKRISHAVIKASKTPATGASISLIEKTSPASAKPACARTSRGSIASPCRY